MLLIQEDQRFCKTFLWVTFGTILLLINSGESTTVSKEFSLKEYVHPVRVSTAKQRSYFPGQSHWRKTKTREYFVRYKLSAFNRTFHLELEQEESFLSPMFHVQKLETGTKNVTFSTSSETEINCFYRGRVKDDGKSRVCVSLCRGMLGLIHTSHGVFFIEPLLWIGRRTKTGKRVTTTHVMKMLQAPTMKKRSVINSGFEERIIRRKMKRGITHLKFDKSWRNKRSVSVVRYVKVMIAVDYKMAEFHRSNLHTYVLTLMASVSLMYKDPSIGNALNIVIVKLIVMDEKEARDIIFPYASKTLKNFCRWQHSNDHQESNLHFDTAILLTRENLCRTSNSCDTLGLAHPGMICDPYSSCAIVQDNGLGAAFTIAHELGHMLGMPHDDHYKCKNHRDDQNDGNHLMSRVLDYSRDPWGWSGCSRWYLTEFLDTGQGDCLVDTPSKDYMIEKYSYPRQRPGELYDMDAQCEFVFGPGYKICPEKPVCKLLWCTRDSYTFKGCQSQKVPWADGTPCGRNKQCSKGNCVDSTTLSNREPVDGQWGKWQPFGQCSRECGGGIQSSSRECNNPSPANGGRYCVGKRKRYRSCNIQDCPPGTPDFRAQQCSNFNGKTLNYPGLPHDVKWIPHYGEYKEACKLYCRVLGTFRHYLLKGKVIDGTTCGIETFDVCVNGQCKAAGCDHLLGSNKTLDICGVCGGDNSTCKKVMGHFNKTSFGYNSVVVIPAGARNIVILQHGHNNSHNDGNYLVLKGSDNNYLLNGDYSVTPFRKRVYYGETTIDYSGCNAVIERINSSKTLSKNLAVQVLNVGRLYPPDVHYMYVVSSVNHDLHHWVLRDKWSDCNRLCQGERFRLLVCMRKHDGQIVSDINCNLNSKPPKLAQVCNTHCTLRWQVMASSKCSSYCGKGKKFRTVKCLQQKNMFQLQEVADAFCDHTGTRPEDTEECEGPCLKSYWIFGQWSSCSKSCGGGRWTRTATCVSTAGKRMPESSCEASKKITLKTCNSEPCPEWKVGNWTQCSVTCGIGFKTRTVFCQSIIGKVVKKELCDYKKRPQEIADCRDQPCQEDDKSQKISNHIPPFLSSFIRSSLSKQLFAGSIYHTKNFKPFPPIWKVSSWSECSVTCGKGVRKRAIHCQASESGHIFLPAYACHLLSRPPTQKSCQLLECEQWKTYEWGQCSVTCGQGIMTRDVICQLPDGQTGNPGACMKDTQPVYQKICYLPACERTSYLQPKPIALINNDIQRFFWRIGPWSKCSRTCDGGLQRRQVACFTNLGEISSYCNPVHKPREIKVCNVEHCPSWFASSWSKCSQSCGKGIQFRVITCINHVKSEVPLHHCNFSTRPVRTQPCFSRQCWPSEYQTRWYLGPWGSCSSTCGWGRQERFYYCHQNNKSVDFTLCRLPIPSEIRPCKLRSCIFHWKKGKWNKCSATCGRAVEKRKVICTDLHGKVVEDKMCMPKKKPRITRKCRHIPPCPFIWKAGKWSLCNRSCNPGIQIRTAHCYQVNLYGWMDPKPLAHPHDHNQTWCDENSQPKLIKSCNLGNCNDGVAWKPGPWQPCSVTCGTGMQKRRVPCYNLNGKKINRKYCHHSMRPKRRRKCYKKPCKATSCQDHQKNTLQDGEQDIVVRGHSIKVYCSRMNSSHPQEYIKLPSGESDNFSEIYNKRLIEPESCPYNGARHRFCPCVEEWRMGAGYTTFSYIAINITSLQVLTDDFAFSNTHGYPVKFGEAGDCYSLVPCPQGTFSINLVGTGLKISKKTKWKTHGHHATIKIDRLEEGQLVHGKCGGYCGKCKLDAEIGLLLDVASPGIQ
ncbi:A disintegrin and metalloproteinase with thrombospondin motifs 9-like isoform X2 [Tachypleus tridentatus]|uniref:A disintegrin and metalloproteinase with thrombospondin motifs 9-like isoform X2 n=1 Tax=Tachypleus tridentatus TaxID=6853 RepID=UPI003FD6B4FB